MLFRGLVARRFPRRLTLAAVQPPVPILRTCFHTSLQVVQSNLSNIISPRNNSNICAKNSNFYKLKPSVRRRVFHASTDSMSDQSEQIVRVVSWNIDGLDNSHDDVEIRTVSALQQICALPERPHFILLQEVTDLSLFIIEEFCKTHKYEVSVDSEIVRGDYFCVILSDPKSVKLKSFQSLSYEKTMMQRSAYFADAEVYQKKVRVGTTHLESSANGKEYRMIQFEDFVNGAFEDMDDDLSSRIILAGDLNIRETEWKALKRAVEEKNGKDVWQYTGENKDTRWTWDMLKNNNYEETFQSRKPQSRFDRMFSFGNHLIPVEFTLFGTQKCDELETLDCTECSRFKSKVRRSILASLRDEIVIETPQSLYPHHRFASDHWAILSHFILQ